MQSILNNRIKYSLSVSFYYAFFLISLHHFQIRGIQVQISIDIYYPSNFIIWAVSFKNVNMYLYYIYTSKGHWLIGLFMYLIVLLINVYWTQLLCQALSYLVGTQWWDREIRSLPLKGLHLSGVDKYVTFISTFYTF